MDDTVKLASRIFSVSHSTLAAAGHGTGTTLAQLKQVQTAQVAYLPLGVAEDHCLCDGERVIQVTQRIKLPLLLLNSNKKLLDALQCQLVTGREWRDTW